MRLAALDVRDPTLLSHENLIVGGSFRTRPECDEGCVAPSGNTSTV